MKKFVLYLATVLMLLTLVPMQLQAVRGPSPATTTIPESAEANALTTRLMEIKEMDKSQLSSTEKKQLRKEVRSIKSELKRTSNGVYLSLGAIIIIVLLLILLL